MSEKLLKRATPFEIILMILMSILALSILYPFYNAVLVSVTPQNDYIRTPFMLFPKHIIFDNYIFVFKARLIWTGFATTLCITILGTAYNMLLTVLSAYALTKPLPGKKIIRIYVIFTMYFSGGVIPFYLLMKDIGLIDKVAVMILPTGIAIMYMIILTDYFTSLPASLEESAKIDGAGDFTILFRIILPLSLPLLATFTLYYAVDRWNEWFNGMLFIKTSEKLPLQMVLRKIISDAAFVSQQLVPGQKRPDVYGDSIKMAAIVVTMFPMMMIYPFLQRYFLSGLTLGGVKE